MRIRFLTQAPNPRMPENHNRSIKRSLIFLLAGLLCPTALRIANNRDNNGKDNREKGSFALQRNPDHLSPTYPVRWQRVLDTPKAIIRL